MNLINTLIKRCKKFKEKQKKLCVLIEIYFNFIPNATCMYHIFFTFTYCIPPTHHTYHNQTCPQMLITPPTPTEYCMLSNNIYDYRIVSQGKTTIPSVDDAEEYQIVDVRYSK